MIRHALASLAAFVLMAGTAAIATQDEPMVLAIRSSEPTHLSFDLATSAGSPLATSLTSAALDLDHWHEGQPLPTANQRPLMRPGALYETHVLASLPTNLRGQSDLMCLAVAIYHEARGETLEGKRAVASVIMQRAMVPNRWGSRPCEVVVPIQFSFLRADYSFAPIDEYTPWIESLEVATVALVEGPDPIFMAADHYHTRAVDPDWNDTMPVVDRIGFHVFYADPRSRRAIQRHEARLSGPTS